MGKGRESSGENSDRVKLTEEQREKIKKALIARQDERFQQTLEEIEKVKQNTKSMVDSMINEWKERVGDVDDTIQETLRKEKSGNDG